MYNRISDKAKKLVDQIEYLNKKISNLVKESIVN